MAHITDSYRSIIKGTSVFGSVQIFQILINLVRGKFVALFLGPAGMGVSAIFASTADFFNTFSSLGLNLAFVKETAAAGGNQDKLARILAVATRLTVVTASCGAVLGILLSPWLSKASFGTADYTWQFILLAVAIWFAVSANAKLSILQGLRCIRYIARASLGGALVGLCTGIPLYWWLGTHGIVPAMALLALSNFCFCTYALKKTGNKAARSFSWKENRVSVSRMVRTGLVLLSSSLINMGCVYLLNILIRKWGGLADVGLFNAANSITAQYAGVVFTAMSMDYLPRLSAASGNNRAMNALLNRQLEIVALVATPLLILLILTAPLVIRILLTSSFLPVTPLMRWLGFGIMLKALAYPLGYIAFAKNNRKAFFWMEAVAGNAIYLIAALLGYRWFGLMGLGYAIVGEYTLCIAMYLIVNKVLYNTSLFRRSLGASLTALLLCGVCCVVSVLSRGWIAYAIMGCAFAVASLRAVMILRRRLGREK